REAGPVVAAQRLQEPGEPHPGVGQRPGQYVGGHVLPRPARQSLQNLFLLRGDADLELRGSAGHGPTIAQGQVGVNTPVLAAPDRQCRAVRSTRAGTSPAGVLAGLLFRSRRCLLFQRRRAAGPLTSPTPPLPEGEEGIKKKLFLVFLPSLPRG